MPCLLHAGLSFFYEEQGAGPAFVFSHGLGGDYQRALELTDGLPGLRVIVYDNRGHGRTSPLPEPSKLNFAEMADDVAALLDHLSIESAFVGGVSMGAGLALACARRHPERVRALVISRPAWLDRPNPPNLGFAPIMADLVERFGRNEARRRFEETAYYRELYRKSPEPAKSLADILATCEPEALVRAYRAIPASTPVSSLQELRELGIPALVLGTRDDPVHPFDFAEALARALPKARLCEVPSRYVDLAAHLREFRRAVTAFLGAV
jgi:pimeloyl-ACP methyl ester carboxylesterase